MRLPPATSNSRASRSLLRAAKIWYATDVQNELTRAPTDAR
jgi:hypothetical protein